jgi:hypothetical protein
MLLRLEETKIGKGLTQRALRSEHRGHGELGGETEWLVDGALFED